MDANSRKILLDWTRKMFEAEANWEAAKDRFVALKKGYTKGLRGTALADAETRASSDPEIKKAIADTAYYREEMLAYATLIRTYHELVRD